MFVYTHNFDVLFAIFIKLAKFNQQIFVYTTNFAVLFAIFIKLAKFNQRRFVYTTNFVVRLIKLTRSNSAVRNE